MQQPPPPPRATKPCPNCNDPGLPEKGTCPNCGWTPNPNPFSHPLLLAVAMVFLGTGSCTVEYAFHSPQLSNMEQQGIALAVAGTLYIWIAGIAVLIAVVRNLKRLGYPHLRDDPSTSELKFPRLTGRQNRVGYQTLCVFGAIVSFGFGALVPFMDPRFLLVSPLVFFILAFALSVASFFKTPKIEGEPPPFHPKPPTGPPNSS